MALQRVARIIEDIDLETVALQRVGEHLHRLLRVVALPREEDHRRPADAFGGVGLAQGRAVDPVLNRSLNVDDEGTALRRVKHEGAR